VGSVSERDGIEATVDQLMRDIAGPARSSWLRRAAWSIEIIAGATPIAIGRAPASPRWGRVARTVACEDRHQRLAGRDGPFHHPPLARHLRDRRDPHADATPTGRGG
jgi:hypothetical protein